MWELSLGVMPCGGLRHSVAKLFVKPLWDGKRGASRLPFRRWHNINLVDPASSHMLVSKIKPCMSQYKYSTAKLLMANKNLNSFLDGNF